MLKLMKYEFRKSASSKLILLVLTAVFELAFLGGVFFKGYNLMGTGMMFLILCAFFGVFYIGPFAFSLLKKNFHWGEI